MKYLAIALLLVPANVGCAAIPGDGSLIEAMRARAPACECTVSVACGAQGAHEQGSGE